jgi:hypothetical protein
MEMTPSGGAYDSSACNVMPTIGMPTVVVLTMATPTMVVPTMVTPIVVTLGWGRPQQWCLQRWCPQMVTPTVVTPTMVMPTTVMPTMVAPTIVTQFGGLFENYANSEVSSLFILSKTVSCFSRRFLLCLPSFLFC